VFFILSAFCVPQGVHLRVSGGPDHEPVLPVLEPAGRL
jgi:hypothetical protein